MSNSSMTGFSLDVTTSLRPLLRGQVIGPDDDGYDAARTVFYRGYDRRPSAIIVAADTADVVQAIEAARLMGVELAVRSGGHSLAGHGVTDGGIVLDLARMRRLEVDRERRTAWVETGLTTGEYTAATGAMGLATGFGDAPSVGIGGITLGGGVGFLHRSCGLALDNVLAADIVTADGRQVRTHAASHPDLFWAIRGGGGNFGVAVRFQLRLHEVDNVLGGLLVLPATPGVLASFLAEADAAPEALSGVINVMPAPPMPGIPDEHHGRPIVMAQLVYAGSAEAGDRVMAPFRSLAAPLVDQIRPMRYAQVFQGPGGAPHPAAMAVRSLFLDRFDTAAAVRVLEGLQTSSAPIRVVQFRVLGGAVARVPVGATAFAHRRRRFMVTVAAAYELPEEGPLHHAWAAGIAAALNPGTAGAYVGFLGDEDGARVREAYPSPAWERLREIKARYDPDNLFRLNQNIPPADPASSLS